MSSELRGVIPDEIIDPVLWEVDVVCATDFVADLDASRPVSAIAQLAGAMSAVDTPMKKHLISFTLVDAAMAAYQVIAAARDPSRARDCMSRAAKAANKAVARVKVLEGEAALMAAAAARRDYEILVASYGEHDEVVIGDPINCFNDA